ARLRVPGVRPGRPRDDPDARRRRVHLGVRLPSLLSPGEAALARARLAERMARPADRTTGGLARWTSTTPPKKLHSVPRRARGSMPTPSCWRRARSAWAGWTPTAAAA